MTSLVNVTWGEKMRISVVIFAAAALAATAADARQVRPGQHVLGGVQGVCVLADGTWYGTTFPNWSGHWVYQANVHTSFFYGNYAAGAGNDHWAVHRLVAAWTEWRDDIDFSTILAPIPFQRTGRRCAPRATSEAEDDGSNPLDAR